MSGGLAIPRRAGPQVFHDTVAGSSDEETPLAESLVFHEAVASDSEASAAGRVRSARVEETTYRGRSS